MKENLFKYDIYRYTKKYKVDFRYLYQHPEVHYLKIFRKVQSGGILTPFYKFKMLSMKKKYHIQIPKEVKIDKGFYIGHWGRIIINPHSIIGKNCNICTGVTIGLEARGKREGAPIIGDEVYIGTNAVIVGKVKIGNNVLIAPNCYINFDVPSNSIVIGNPGKIIHNDNATSKYIVNKC